MYVNEVRIVSHLVVELWALVVVQDRCISAAGKQWVSWLAVDALKGKQAYQSSNSGPLMLGHKVSSKAEEVVISDYLEQRQGE